MKDELISALTDLCAEKGIEKEVILDALEAALIAAYKRNFASAQNVCVEIDRENGKIGVYAQKTVVEEVRDAQQEISLEDAISDLEERIAALEADIADISAIENQELMIERYKNRISASEAKVAILEAKVAEAKKALDAATATE